MLLKLFELAFYRYSNLLICDFNGIKLGMRRYDFLEGNWRTMKGLQGFAPSNPWKIIF